MNSSRSSSSYVPRLSRTACVGPRSTGEPNVGPLHGVVSPLLDVVPGRLPWTLDGGVSRSRPVNRGKCVSLRLLMLSGGLPRPVSRGCRASRRCRNRDSKTCRTWASSAERVRIRVTSSARAHVAQSRVFVQRATMACRVLVGHILGWPGPVNWHSHVTRGDSWTGCHLLDSLTRHGQKVQVCYCLMTIVTIPIVLRECAADSHTVLLWKVRAEYSH